MRRIGDLLHYEQRDDLHDCDHQEHVEPGTRDIVLIAGAALLLIGGFVASLM